MEDGTSWQFSSRSTSPHSSTYHFNGNSAGVYPASTKPGINIGTKHSGTQHPLSEMPERNHEKSSLGQTCFGNSHKFGIEPQPLLSEITSQLYRCSMSNRFTPEHRTTIRAASKRNFQCSILINFNKRILVQL